MQRVVKVSPMDDVVRSAKIVFELGFEFGKANTLSALPPPKGDTLGRDDLILKKRLNPP